MKVCTKCEIEKPSLSFHKKSAARDGYNSRCKECVSKRDRAHYLKNLNECKKNSRDYYKNNREKVLKYKKDYFLVTRELRRNYEREQHKNNINARLARNLRNRLRGALKNNTKEGSAVSDLGCSIEELKKYLESLFTEGMSWDNYGEWHIDHIKPLASFDLIEKDQLLEACHFTNLQPLWAEENLSKQDKLLDLTR